MEELDVGLLTVKSLLQLCIHKVGGWGEAHLPQES